jgi:diguanylate cyclase (GGDEF)-like protein
MGAMTSSRSATSHAGPAPPPALAAIWQRHRTAVLEQVAALERAARSLADDSLDAARREDARRQAHQLAGSLGTFGSSAGSEDAHKLELLLAGAGLRQPTDALRFSLIVAELRAAVEELPGLDDATAPGPAAAAETAPLLLIVEDDLQLARRLAPEATRRGMRVELAATPAAARAVLARERPAVVLLDLTFETGTQDAYALLSELTALDPSVPVLVSTVRDTLVDRVEVVRRGGHGFVTKSLPPQQVIHQVVQLLDRRHARDITLLAVDDDPLLLDVVRALLEPCGYRVMTLDDPLRFWSELDRIRPDLVLLDVTMPDVSGLELCRVLRNDARWATVPVLVLTALRDAATLEQIFAAGADDYLAKPVVGSELLVRVRNRVERLQLHRALAETDSLTGVPNRLTSTQSLDRLLRLAARYEQPLALAAIDLDHFKHVNDQHGHAAGDSVLRRLGARLLEAFRGEDVVGRWGGEEFIVGMYGMHGGAAAQRLADVLDAFRDERFADDAGDAFTVAFSAGIATYPDDGTHLAALYRVADNALYRAKDAGRGRILAA